jgi:hypothetical protein
MVESPKTVATVQFFVSQIVLLSNFSGTRSALEEYAIFQVI